jgi:hypothetical protein
MTSNSSSAVLSTAAPPRQLLPIRRLLKLADLLAAAVLTNMEYSAAFVRYRWAVNIGRPFQSCNISLGLYHRGASFPDNRRVLTRPRNRHQRRLRVDAVEKRGLSATRNDDS